MTSPENWLPVVGFEGRYEVSDLGRVRSFWEQRAFRRRPRAEPLVLRTPLDNHGRAVVEIAARSRRVHILVLTAFRGARPAGLEASHLNGDRTDNRLVNLVWETPSANCLRRRAHGTGPDGDRNPSRMYPERQVRGVRHPQAKLTECQVIEIRAARARGERGCDLARLYGVCQTTISAIARGRVWRHLVGVDTGPSVPETWQ
jgi:hypothetical protein